MQVQAAVGGKGQHLRGQQLAVSRHYDYVGLQGGQFLLRPGGAEGRWLKEGQIPFQSSRLDRGLLHRLTTTPGPVGWGVHANYLYSRRGSQGFQHGNHIGGGSHKYQAHPNL